MKVFQIWPVLFIIILLASGVIHAAPNEDLINAAMESDLAGVQRALDAGADPNAKDAKGVAAIWHACWTTRDNTPIVQLLIARGASVNVRNMTGQGNRTTPLMGAANFNLTEMARVLLDAGADINSADGGGMTALSMASEPGKEEIARLLLSRGARDDIFSAARRGDVEGLRKFPAKSMNGLDRTYGMTPLHFACWYGQIDAARYLLGIGASPEAGVWGTTALMTACEYGRIDIIRLLLEKKAKVNARTVQNETALYTTVVSGLDRTVKITVLTLLLEHGADPAIRPKNNLSPIESTNDPDIITLLKKHGAKQTPGP